MEPRNPDDEQDLSASAVESNLQSIEINPRDWWNSLDKNWKEVFHNASGIYEEPTESDIKEMLDLEYVKLYVNQQQVESITDLTPLKYLNKVKQITGIGSTKVTDLSPISDLLSLNHLDISSAKLSNINPIKNLARLENIYASGSSIQSLKPIMDMPLKAFYFYGCNIPQKEIDEFRQINPYCYIDMY